MIAKNAKNKELLPELFNSVELSPLTEKYDLSDTSKFAKVTLNSSEKAHLSAFISQMPIAAVAGAMPDMYIVKFPEGVNGTLMRYKTGGVGSAIMGEKGISGHAAFFNMSKQAAFLGLFTAMSIASSQYFLTQINSELNMINLKIDKILGFLYGDKKAELLSEISYAKRAFDNFSSVVRNEYHRSATLNGIIQSGKIAIKDIEFYIQDLDAVCSSEIKSAQTLEKTANEAIHIRESLNLSLQLYIMCCVLELIYSQNFEAAFVEWLKNDLIIYIDKCNNRMNTSFGALYQSVTSFKQKIPIGTKYDKVPIEEKISNILEELHNGEASNNRKAVESVLNSCLKPTEYIISGDEVYYKI